MVDADGCEEVGFPALEPRAPPPALAGLRVRSPSFRLRFVPIGLCERRGKDYIDLLASRWLEVRYRLLPQMRIVAPDGIELVDAVFAGEGMCVEPGLIGGRLLICRRPGDLALDRHQYDDVLTHYFLHQVQRYRLQPVDHGPEFTSRANGIGAAFGVPRVQPHSIEAACWPGCDRPMFAEVETGKTRLRAPYQPVYVPPAQRLPVVGT